MVAEDEGDVAAETPVHVDRVHGVVRHELNEAGVLQLEQGLTRRRAVDGRIEDAAALQDVKQGAEEFAELLV